MGRRCPNCGHKNEVAWKFCSNCAFKNTEEIASCSYHFVVLGSGGVGKSCIVIQFVNGIFEPRYDPTIEDRYQKVIEYKGVPCLLEILDTAGQETFSAMRELYMTDGQGFVLVYSITSRKSIEDLVGIRESILTHKNSDNVGFLFFTYSGSNGSRGKQIRFSQKERNRECGRKGICSSIWLSFY
eukprot:TRINITY_DN5643_c0_g1_i2.p1 TRINITY_DN5643_c0_g1~~TRINITY_DN5643_c0_g1_i2.p1  ORF type:complete len:209 (-),score=28.10 TRINITY_DN5643_c0_g1_i2:221-772(-)